MLKSNYGKSKYNVRKQGVQGTNPKRGKGKPSMMGDYIMEESDEEKYLGDMIHTNGTGSNLKTYR